MNEKIEQLKTDLINANNKLKEAFSINDDREIIRDGTIQRFEFTFELAWKYMMAILKHQGIIAYGPKEVIREAGRVGLIDNVDIWLGLQIARNLSTHTYKEETANKVEKEAKNLPALIDKLVEN